jgi:hypothetical protein
MSIEAMKEALEAFEHIQGMSWSIVTTATCKRNISNLRQAIEQAEKEDMYKNPDTGNPCEGWDNEAKPEQAEKQFNPDWDQQAVLVERIRELEAQQALDKKADNARELGLDYEPDPVAYIDHVSGKPKFIDGYVVQTDYDIPLYTAPQKYCPSENNAAYEKGFVEGMAKQMHSSVDRAVNAMAKQWVGLTDAELAEFSAVKLGAYDLCLEVEAKLRERNT